MFGFLFNVYNQQQQTAAGGTDDTTPTERPTAIPAALHSGHRAASMTVLQPAVDILQGAAGVRTIWWCLCSLFFLSFLIVAFSCLFVCCLLYVLCVCVVVVVVVCWLVVCIIRRAGTTCNQPTN